MQLHFIFPEQSTQDAPPARIPRTQTAKWKAYKKAWDAANPRDRRAYKKAYDEAHREENRAYREANQERLSTRAKAYYQANREQILARVKSYTEENKARILQYQAEYYVENTDKVKSRTTAWQKANPDRRSHHANTRRLRKMENGGSHTFEEREAKFAEFGNVCAYCGKAKRLSIDHMIPLSRGGTDDIENIVPACRSCNSKKHDKTVEEFFAYLDEQSGR